MRYSVYDKKYNYKYLFDTKSGFYMRTGILDENGKDTGVDPFMSSFPHLIEVGIMGHCIHGESGLCKAAGVQCYQSGYSVKKPDMTVADFESIAVQCKHITNQLALGGRGDPNQHKQFEAFRDSLRKSCPDCPDREFCMGGCPLVPDVAICPSKKKRQLYSI